MQKFDSTFLKLNEIFKSGSVHIQLYLNNYSNLNNYSSISTFSKYLNKILENQVLENKISEYNINKLFNNKHLLENSGIYNDFMNIIDRVYEMFKLESNVQNERNLELVGKIRSELQYSDTDLFDCLLFFTKQFDKKYKEYNLAGLNLLFILFEEPSKLNKTMMICNKLFGSKFKIN